MPSACDEKSTTYRSSYTDERSRCERPLTALDEPIMASASIDLAEHVVSCWKEKISEEVGEHGVATDYTDEDDESDDSYDKAKEELTKFVRDALDEYAIIFDSADVDAVVDEFDFRYHLQNNRKTHYRTEGGGRGYSGNDISGSEEEQIDDLFQRDR